MSEYILTSLPSSFLFLPNFACHCPDTPMLFRHCQSSVRLQSVATVIFLLLAMATAKSVKCCRVSLPLIQSHLYKHYKDSRQPLIQLQQCHALCFSLFSVARSSKSSVCLLIACSMLNCHSDILPLKLQPMYICIHSVTIAI